MGRKKGSLNKKTLHKIKNMDMGGKAVTPTGQSTSEIEHMKEQMSKMQDIISGLTKQIGDQKSSTGSAKIASQYKLKDLDKVNLLTNTEVEDLETARAEAIRELNGHRKILKEALGGTVIAFEKQTAPDKTELYKRIAFANRALAQQGRPNVSAQELNILRKEYNILTEELRKLVPSQKAQWAVGTPEYSEAIQQHVLLMTTYAPKVRRWQNIGKLLDPNDSKLWNIDKLGK